MSEQAFISAISEGNKDEVIKWLQKIYSENEQLRHDITRHVQICAEHANEIVELRKQLEQAEGRCKKLWDEIARIHGATSPASPQGEDK